MRVRFVAALLVIVGCRAQEKSLAGTDAVAADLSVTVPSEVKQGDFLPVDVTLTNVGEKALVLESGGYEVQTDILREETGVQFYSLPGPVTTAEYRPKTVQPGASIRITRSWDLRNGSGTLATPGTYRIRAVTLIPGDSPVEVVSSPVTFVITR